jgi:hypothetical protein
MNHSVNHKVSQWRLWSCARHLDDSSYILKFALSGQHEKYIVISIMKSSGEMQYISSMIQHTMYIAGFPPEGDKNSPLMSFTHLRMINSASKCLQMTGTLNFQNQKKNFQKTQVEGDIPP